MVYQIHIAPMMGYTHKHFRFLMRRLCPNALLYTEMVTTGALLYGDASAHLSYDCSERPVVLQLGGNDPVSLAKCAKMAQDYGYSQVNFNVGCPSSRVQEGGIGACLYPSYELVSQCVQSMNDAVDIPVSVKCRIGVDDCDDFDYLLKFTESLQVSGCDFIVIHARKAWLKGLSPKQNRTIPPLRYDVVSRLSDLVDMPVILNGGLVCLDEIQAQLSVFPGVMIGRFAVNHPMRISRLDQMLYGSSVDYLSALESYFLYMNQQIDQGEKISFLLQPLHGFFRSFPGSKHWRSHVNSIVKAVVEEHKKPSCLLDATLLKAEHYLSLS
ncbi:MAG: tRNA dihydrouridine(20/20a) synthase DusA [Pseudomonadota bacterium]|nr:tRNA dihydrouridine(20/20a) synthase DusA [Pseudomonadota bacterium]